MSELCPICGNGRLVPRTPTSDVLVVIDHIDCVRRLCVCGTCNWWSFDGRCLLSEDAAVMTGRGLECYHTPNQWERAS